jgi:prevent-host-death family protein
VLEAAMQTTIDLPEATVSLHDLVRRAVQGDEIIIAEAGTPLVRLVPIVPQPPQSQRRRAGLSEGVAVIAQDFDAPLPDAFWLGEE